MLNQLKKVNREHSTSLKYSLLIPSWNNLEYLQLCINSIRKNSSFTHQLIVLINEGNDGTLNWVESQSDIDYVYSPKNIGICYGLNACRSLVKTDFMVYINDDMYLLPGWDSAFDNEIKQLNHRLFMLSATMIEPVETGNPCVLVQNYGRDMVTFREADLLNNVVQLNKDDWFGSTWPPNILPTELWDLVGGMSIEFSPGFYSDPDLSMKLWKAGVRHFKGLGNSKVYHFGSKSTKRVRINKGSDQFLMKWGLSSNTFVVKFLKRGEKYSGILNEPKLSKLLKWKNKLKRMLKA
ncbi:MAG: family 2 glycosyl transferase [Bacteroidetes bacterium HGW-Bacteroidetes-4]|jgi:glycosyltransferase involved in cell wall biosynthesis|nr:MAG: family 2 glycosyl transferase [Bacteroidetes bacterium HGW-Bacteroidetes-4]